MLKKLRDELDRKLNDKNRELNDLKRENFRQKPSLEPVPDDGLPAEKVTVLAQALDGLSEKTGAEDAQQFAVTRVLRRLSTSVLEGTPPLPEVLEEINCIPKPAPAPSQRPPPPPEPKKKDSPREQQPPAPVVAQQEDRTPTKHIEALGKAFEELERQLKGCPPKTGALQLVPLISWSRRTLDQAIKNPGGGVSSPPAWKLGKLMSNPSRDTGMTTDPVSDDGVQAQLEAQMQAQLEAKLGRMREQFAAQLKAAQEAAAADRSAMEQEMQTLREQLLTSKANERKLRDKLMDMQRIMKGKGLGKELDEAMRGSGLSDYLNQNQSVFERLYEDALRRMRVLAEREEMRMQETTAAFVAIADATVRDTLRDTLTQVFGRPSQNMSQESMTPGVRRNLWPSVAWGSQQHQHQQQQQQQRSNTPHEQIFSSWQGPGRDQTLQGSSFITLEEEEEVRPQPAATGHGWASTGGHAQTSSLFLPADRTGPRRAATGVASPGLRAPGQRSRSGLLPGLTRGQRGEWDAPSPQAARTGGGFVKGGLSASSSPAQPSWKLPRLERPRGGSQSMPQLMRARTLVQGGSKLRSQLGGGGAGHVLQVPLPGDSRDGQRPPESSAMEFDVRRSTEEVYGVAAFTGVNAEFRAMLDYSYHAMYCEQRVLIQDDLLQRILSERSVQLPDDAPSWAIFFVGNAAQESAAILSWMEQQGQLPLKNFVEVDSQAIQRRLPEWSMYEACMALSRDQMASDKTRKEANCLAELLACRALQERRNVVIHASSWRSVSWPAVYFQRLRNKFPGIRVMVLHATQAQQDAPDEAAGIEAPGNSHTAWANLENIRTLAAHSDFVCRVTCRSGLPIQLGPEPNTSTPPEEVTWELFRKLMVGAARDAA